jgi:hypothetical protein
MSQALEAAEAFLEAWRRLRLLAEEEARLMRPRYARTGEDVELARAMEHAIAVREARKRGHRVPGSAHVARVTNGGGEILEEVNTRFWQGGLLAEWLRAWAGRAYAALGIV